MSGDPGPSSKAISSLVKKPSDVTRQGTQKLKFVPVLPTRRKPVKTESEPAPAERAPVERGRGDGRGRGRDRGSVPRPPTTTMIASGPFAMGPALAGGNNARRSIPRSNFVPPVGIPGAPAPGATLTGTPAVKTEERKGKERLKFDDDEYSEPDDGVQIIDLDDVKTMDWMAPDALRKEPPRQKRVKTEDSGVDEANALDLSESEDEEDMENIQECFLPQYGSTDSSLREERLYFFQFPSPFPQFAYNSDDSPKKVSFAADTKTEEETEKAEEETSIDGVIGQLEVYQSGAVKMRLSNGIVLDVTGATQPSFLQYAVDVDLAGKQMSILGEVNKKFVVTPDIDALLSALEKAEIKQADLLPGEDDLIRMDTS